MRKFRIFVLGTAWVLALGIVGAVSSYAGAAEHAVDLAGAAAACQPSTAANDLRQYDSGWAQQQMRKDDIRWAQVELRTRGIYKGSLDGVLGPETKRALQQFQRGSGLTQTASLDAQTWEALTGDAGTGLGSSTQYNPENPGSKGDSSAESDLGK